MPRCLARVCSSAVSGVAASTEAPTIGAICSRVFDRMAALWAGVSGVVVVAGAPAVVVAGAAVDGVGTVAAVLPGATGPEVAGGVELGQLLPGQHEGVLGEVVHGLGAHAQGADRGAQAASGVLYGARGILEYRNRAMRSSRAGD